MDARAHEETVGAAKVAAATGRERTEWFALLDEAGATAWDHSRIASWLVESHGVAGWWAQGITVGYEQARGMRLPGQRSDGTFATSVSRTVPVPVADAFPYLADDDLRRRWLDVDWTVTGITEPRSVRLRADGTSRVTLALTEVAGGRVRVGVGHERLPGAEHVAGAKAFWQDALGRLAECLAGPRPGGAARP